MKTATSSLDHGSEENTASAVTRTQTATSTGWYDQLLKDAEFNRYGLMSMFILITCCMGGVAFWAMGANFNIPTLALLVSCTLVPLILMLAITPMKIILPAVATSTAISIITAIAYLLVS
jgi:hypothetical protein